MATLPGGPSNTFGNEFQALWIAHLLVDVLRGAAASVRIEPGDAFAPKAECVVYRGSGVLEAHQCKRQNGTKGSWTIANLEHEGIITAAAHFLTISSDHRFVFVSGDPAPGLATLCERGRQFDSIPEFRKEAATNEVTRRDLDTLLGMLKLDLQRDEDVRALMNFLMRFDVIVEDVRRQRRRIEDYAERWIEGQPRAIVHLLEHLAHTTVRRELSSRDLVTALQHNSFFPRDLTIDHSLPLKINEICDRYERSFHPTLICGELLQRSETTELLAAIEDPVSRVILIHGAGGSGKSGVLYETVHTLRLRHQPCLAIRLDQEEIGFTPAECGQHLGLPASPITCLASTAAGQRSILVIDQLDSIRWTSRHSPRALDVVTQLLDVAMRQPEMKVVIACRSFDAANDDRLRTLFSSIEDKHSLRKLEVGLLSNEVFTRLPQSLRESINSTTRMERETLRSVKNLWLFSKLLVEVGQPAFASGSDLNRQYWIWVRQQLPETAQTTFNQHFVPDVVDTSLWTDAIPKALCAQYADMVDRLLSISALIRVGRATRFAHQAHFDYLAAERLSELLRKRHMRLTEWLRGHDELFHRHQLRQLLEMIRDDDHKRFLEEVESVAIDDQVRFHQRQLALQVLGSPLDPLAGELDLLMKLDANVVLSPDVRQVFNGAVGWFDLLYERGQLRAWIESTNPADSATATWLMRTFVGQRGATVHAQISSLKPELHRQYFEAVLQFASLATVPASLFAQYLRLVHDDSGATGYTDLKALAAQHPSRALRLFRAYSRQLLRTLHRDLSTNSRRERLEHVIFDNRDALLALAGSKPHAVFSGLWSLYNRCSSLRRKSRRLLRGQLAVDNYVIRRDLSRLARLLEDLLTTAGTVLAGRRPAFAFKQFQPLLANPTRARRIAVKSMVGLPAGFADPVLAALSSSPSLLVCGASRYSLHYRGAATIPARKLIRRFSAFGSSQVLSRLEAAICRVVPPWERRDWRYAHKVLMGDTVFGPSYRFYIPVRTIFAAQYLLLLALPPDQLSSHGRDWLGVLSRKFGPPDNLLKEPPSSWGGFISSSIPEANAAKLSDKSWLRLIRNDGIRPEHRFRNRRSQPLRESTPGLFAGQLERCAHREPTRFAVLASQMPTTCHIEYPTAIVDALGKPEPPDAAPPNWSPASAALSGQVVDRFHRLLVERQFALNFCWLLHNRSDDQWNLITLGRFLAVAQLHPDPDEAADAARSSGSSSGHQDELAQQALNCVRGVAALATATLLSSDSSRYELLKPAISSFSKDPNPTVRVAAMQVALALLSVDRAVAVSFFLQLTAHPSEEIFRSRWLQSFLLHSFLKHFDHIWPVLERMLKSDDDVVAERVGETSTLMYLLNGRMLYEVEAMLHRRAACRRGIAEVLSRELMHLEQFGVAGEWLTRLLNDPEKEVRDIASRLFWQGKFYVHKSAEELLQSFVASAAMFENLDDVLHGLKETDADLGRFAEAIDMMVNRLATSGQLWTSTPSFATHHLPDVLLRLYEISEPGSLPRRRCLDLIDTALRHRFAYNLIPSIE